ncbi:hypothetical protein PV04_07880 [Phialophora macrospora]|uniref:Uncharacterized protein n=1 Tax=Phialophora macrospora TaxID=1851006 RepID=A0A0D2FCB6_9EURO|nr:hypothetical protein PV04_07880 [Phialophora macrospora]
MAPAMDFEAQRLRNLEHKQRLLAELNLDYGTARRDQQTDSTEDEPKAKRRRLDGSTVEQRVSSRTSARIATRGIRISYKEENHSGNTGHRARTKNQKDLEPRGASRVQSQRPRPKATSPPLPTHLASLIQHYTSWTSSAAPPTLDPRTNTYHFASHPSFRPNKSPLSILLQGAFGGTYFSPWRSRSLSVTLEDDYLATLPPDWLAQLQPPEKYITSPTYNPELNRHGWEDAGWINFQHDARGWFEWYIRFWLGRRLDDGEGERQAGRWLRCVGPKGRWKRMLLKKYVEMGVRSVFDDEDGDDDAEEERKVSPVIHQTCLHWGYQVTQEDLDEAWQEKRA